MVALKPTQEQEKAIELFKTGKSLKINAYAGTGKTSTLTLLAHATPRTGQYIAFNKGIVLDAETKFPSRVKCRTSHSLAYNYFKKKYTPEKLSGKINANKLVEILEMTEPYEIDEKHILKPVSLATLYLRTIENFANSEGNRITVDHIPAYSFFDFVGADKKVKSLRKFIVKEASKLWSRMTDPDDDIPLGFSGYLKLWSLMEPQIEADYVLLDEAQDTNGPVLSVLKKQSAQVVYVGDRYQQIYEWRGAINAMEKIKTGNTTYLTKSFRFGEAIAKFATEILFYLGETNPVLGNPQIASKVTYLDRPDTILTRTNAYAISAIIDALKQGQRPYFVGGGQELRAMMYGVKDLRRNIPTTIPDFFGFKSWEEVTEFSGTEDGEHLFNFVNLVNAEHEDKILSALNRLYPENEANVIIATGHKSKGLEWNNVLLQRDFLMTHKSEDSSGKEREVLPASELQLFYVAATRAKQFLEVDEELLDDFRRLSDPYSNIVVGY